MPRARERGGGGVEPELSTDGSGRRCYKRSEAIITHDLNSVVRNLTLIKLRWANSDRRAGVDRK